MKAIFEIFPKDIDSTHYCLLGEISEEGFNVVLKRGNEIAGIGAYQFEKIAHVDAAMDLSMLFHQKEIFAGSFQKVAVQFSFPESTIIPFSLFKREGSQLVLDRLFGDQAEDAELFTELLKERNSYNIYRVPSGICDLLRKQFPGVLFTHRYTTFAESELTDQDEMKIIFSSKKISVAYFSAGNIRLINSYYYKAPEDVSWLLLKILQQCHPGEKEVPEAASSHLSNENLFKLQNSVRLSISGLIERSSILYAELKKYFKNIHFNDDVASFRYDDEKLQYPAHYLSHLFSLDTCV